MSLSDGRIVMVLLAMSRMRAETEAAFLVALVTVMVLTLILPGGLRVGVSALILLLRIRTSAIV